MRSARRYVRLPAPLLRGSERRSSYPSAQSLHCCTQHLGIAGPERHPALDEVVNLRVFGLIHLVSVIVVVGVPLTNNERQTANKRHLAYTISPRPAAPRGPTRILR